MTCACPSMSCRISSAHFTASALNRWRWLVGIQGLHHAARMEGSRTLWFSADGGKFTLESWLQALRIVLEIAGKVRGLRDSVDTLADAICADKARRLSQPARLQRNMRHGPVRQHHAVENP